MAVWMEEMPYPWQTLVSMDDQMGKEIILSSLWKPHGPTEAQLEQETTHSSPWQPVGPVAAEEETILSAPLQLVGPMAVQMEERFQKTRRRNQVHQANFRS